jgi:hypothetical protein
MTGGQANVVVVFASYASLPLHNEFWITQASITVAFLRDINRVRLKVR